MKPLELVIDGTDGAGKTQLVKRLVRSLTSKGVRVAHHAPYREIEVYPLWENEPVRAARAIASVIDAFRERSGDQDLIIWDRGWPTAFVSTDNADARAIMPRADRTILLLGTTEQTVAKAEREQQNGIWVRDRPLVEQYNRRYRALCSEDDLPIDRHFQSARSAFDYEVVVADIIALLLPLLNGRA